MKKVMIMINGLYSGGAEKVLQTVLNNLDYSRLDVTVYSIHKKTIDPDIFKTKDKFRYRFIFDEYSGNSEFNKKIFTYFNKVKGRIFNKYPSLFRLLFMREKYDVEIAFLEGESTKTIAGSHNSKSKKIAWVHTDMIKNNWTDFLFSDSTEEADTYRKFDEIVCVSESVKESFIEKYGVSESVRVLYNPVDSPDVIKKAEEKAEISVSKRPLLISLGRLEEPKGYPRLLECADRLHKEGYEFSLWILGDGIQKNQLEEFIAKNDLGDTVKLLGFHSNPYKYVAAADAFICSSYIEGFSTAATESIILGKPVYTVDCPGMAELFGNEECGKIVPNTDEDLYLLMKDAVTDKDAMEKYTASAKRRAEFFDIKKRMEEIENII